MSMPSRRRSIAVSMTTKRWVVPSLAGLAATGLMNVSVVMADVSGPDQGTLAEVIVTAQKRAQNLQDVPISITALSSDIVERASIAKVTDLAKLVPNFSFESAFGIAQDSRV